HSRLRLTHQQMSLGQVSPSLALSLFAKRRVGRCREAQEFAAAESIQEEPHQALRPRVCWQQLGSLDEFRARLKTRTRPSDVAPDEVEGIVRRQFQGVIEIFCGAPELAGQVIVQAAACVYVLVLTRQTLG